MIYSSAYENWMRVVIMHSIAKDYYFKTQDSEHRKYINYPAENTFCFEVNSHDLMEKEKCLVGMLKAWSVITLEALVNHAIAEISDDKDYAKQAIEYPNKITKKFKSRKLIKCELAAKLMILSDDNTSSHNVILVANDLSASRNAIVHDKPFEFYENSDGEVFTEHFKLREGDREVNDSYEELESFYTQCESINRFIANYYTHQTIGGETISFSKLAMTDSNTA